MSLHARETPIMLHLHPEDVGSILRWTVSEGEQVQRGDVLVTVELDGTITHRVAAEDAGWIYRRIVEDGPMQVVCTPVPVNPVQLHQWQCIGIIIPSDTAWLKDGRSLSSPYVGLKSAVEIISPITGSLERAKYELLSKLKLGEITAIAGRLHITSEITGTRTLQRCALPPDFWHWADVTWGDDADYAHRGPCLRLGLQSSDFSLDPLLTHEAYEIHFSQPELESIWPSDAIATLSREPVPARPHHSRHQDQADQKRPPGRPKGRSLAAADAQIIQGMHRLFRLERAVASPTAAAWTIIGMDGKGALGSGSPESKVRRLVRRYNEQHPMEDSGE